MKDDDLIKKITEQLVKAWEKSNAQSLSSIILDDADIKFSVFGGKLTKSELQEHLEERPRPTAIERFDILNYVNLIEKGRAVQTFAMIALLAGEKEGKWSQFQFEGNFCNELVKTEEGWKYKEIYFELTDVNTAYWPKQRTEGINIVPCSGDDSFVSNWDKTNHEDRIGWFSDRELPIIVPELDAPWLRIKKPENKGTDEKQIEETFFRYAYGIDNGLFELYDTVFSEDAVIKYFDAQPYDKRTVTEMLKFEKQGAIRCIHTGYFKDIKVNNDDTAVGHIYLRATFQPEYVKVTKELTQKRWVWSRYKLEFKKVNGEWRIHRLFFYPGFLTV